MTAGTRQLAVAGMACIALGGIALFSFAMIGSSTGSTGLVSEPFALLPIGSGLIALGGVLLLVALLPRSGKKR